MLKQIIIPFLTWLVGNIIWSGILYIMTRLRPDEPMIWAIGMIGLLVLIVVGVIGVGWYFMRHKVDPNSVVELETMTKVVTAVYYSQKYGVTADELADAITMREMEERAKRLQAEKQLAELRGSEAEC